MHNMAQPYCSGASRLEKVEDLCAKKQPAEPHLRFSSQVWGSLVKSTHWQRDTEIHTRPHKHTKRHRLTSQSRPACYHGNKLSSSRSHRYWSPCFGLEIAAFQHAAHALTCALTSTWTAAPVNGSEETRKTTFTATPRAPLMDCYNVALDSWRKSDQSLRRPAL